MTTTVDDLRLYRPRKFNATTKQRFFKIRTADLVRHAGGSASYAQMILITRIVRNEWDLMKIDAQMDVGTISDFAMRNRLAMENRLRLDLRELGYRAAPKPAKTVQDIIAEHAAKKAAEAAQRSDKDAA